MQWLKKGIHQIPELVVLLIVLFIAFFSGAGLLDNQRMVNRALSENYAEYKPGFDANRFNALKEQNPDVIGWIDLYGTPIDYPITHTNDNHTYLAKDVFGDYSATGAIYLDARNNPDFTDNIKILWGHNMTPQVMFGSIREFLNARYFQDRKYGDIYYDGRHHGVEIYGIVSNTFTNDSAVYRPGDYAGEEVRSFMENLIERSVNKRKADLGKIDNVLLLSTCSSDLTSGKNVLVCTVTDETYEDTFDIDERRIAILDIYSRLPLLLWLIVVVLLLLLIYRILKYLKEKKRKVKKSRSHQKTWNERGR